jgi:hypothetical protein
MDLITAHTANLIVDLQATEARHHRQTITI